MTDSQDLRKTILAQRNKLQEAEIIRKSEIITSKLLGLKEIQNYSNIFAYVSFRSEVATFDLIDTLIGMGKKISVPITRVVEKRLDLVKITNRETDLEPGYCDIPEPTEDLFLTNKTDPKEIEIIILPGSVFDRRGGRFGYGGGYYDRFVSNVPSAVRIGIAFDLQIIDKAPLQPHDEILDYVITEKEIIAGKR